jgi:hypothetical protein
MTGIIHLVLEFMTNRPVALHYRPVAQRKAEALRLIAQVTLTGPHRASAFVTEDDARSGGQVLDSRCFEFFSFVEATDLQFITGLDNKPGLFTVVCWPQPDEKVAGFGTQREIGVDFRHYTAHGEPCNIDWCADTVCR